MAKKNVSGQSTETFAVKEDLDGLRFKPSMYLGELGIPMLHRMVDEVVDNSFDEALAGRNDGIELLYHVKEDWLAVFDEAGGIPVDKIKLKGGAMMSILTAAFFKTHSSGKFDDGAYSASTGTHGIGVSAVTAVSKTLQVWTKRKGQWWTQSFTEANLDHEHPKKVKAPPKDLLEFAQKKGKDYGTIVKFYPDHNVIGENAEPKERKKKSFVGTRAKLDSKLQASKFNDLADLNPNLKLTFTVTNGKKTKTVDFLNKKTPAHAVLNRIERQELDIMGSKTKPINIKTDKITVALAWTDHSDSAYFRTFVNSKRTIDHGKHVDGFKTALEKALKPYATGKAADKGKRSAKKTKSKTGTYKRDDLLIGLFGFFDWKMHGAQFSSQVKDKLASFVEKEVEDIVLPELEAFFAKNKSLAKNIIKRAVEYQKQIDSVKNVMKSMAETRKKSRALLPSVLAVATDAKPHEVEQFLVEGDSAGGTAINGRDSSYQEVVKLKGKPLNVISNPIDKIVGNKVIQDLMVALGVDLKELKESKTSGFTFSTDKLRIQYAIIMADADPDGYHIATTIIGFFVRFMPTFIEEGRLLITVMPLYIGKYKGKLYGDDDLDTLISLMPKGATAKDCKRAKGLGEMGPREIAHFGMDPKSRKLLQVDPPKDLEELNWFNAVVGDSPEARRQLLGLEV